VFLRNILPPSSGSKEAKAKQSNFHFCCLLAGVLLGLLYNPEDGVSMFLHNVGGFYWTT
jgi:hypothetical protein